MNALRVTGRILNELDEGSRFFGDPFNEGREFFTFRRRRPSRALPPSRQVRGRYLFGIADTGNVTVGRRKGDARNKVHSYPAARFNVVVARGKIEFYRNWRADGVFLTARRIGRTTRIALSLSIRSAYSLNANE